MATIFYFSSTGNSLHVAKRIAEQIGDEYSLIPMRNEAVTCSDDVVGFVFPVYFFTLPRMVERFVNQVQITNKNAYVFAAVPHGGQIGGALARISHVLGKKGITVHYGAKLRARSNYLPMYTMDDSEEARRQLDSELSAAAKAIAAKTVRKTSKSTLLLSKLGGSFYPSEDSDRFFTVSDACVHCATCQKVCPADNIQVTDKGVEFLHKCEHCIGCLHNCPKDAIDWKGKTQGKKRYRNHNITLKELMTPSEEDQQSASIGESHKR
ncbi:MAG: EFR1 family ferrodoxin [Coriobacteriia bacterium]|nr:EFR1 family ferrodoxin [Coriobacteriia bacterium]MCL2870472.1 EFR1 family ferrodoxin [Coriobacteriia bacterium]